MSGKISNPRDLLVLLLGEVLHVERRLAGGVIRDLAEAVHDDELRAVLRGHLEETVEHVDRLERAFRRLEVSPTANLSRSFESAVAQHHQLAQTIVEPRLADLFHAQAAFHTEHWEIAAYETALRLAPGEAAGLLEASLDDERRAAGRLLELLGAGMRDAVDAGRS
jgi:ferritin-like metal-binding protein YciE